MGVAELGWEGNQSPRDDDDDDDAVVASAWTRLLANKNNNDDDDDMKKDMMTMTECDWDNRRRRNVDVGVVVSVGSAVCSVDNWIFSRS